MMLEALKTNSYQEDLRSPYGHLDLEYDPDLRILWKFISENSTTSFSHEQLDEIRSVQTAIGDGSQLSGVSGFEPENLRYVVFGSRLARLYSLGGDLKLFRDLIEARDRSGLEFYARKATDAVYHHATNTRNVTTFSLVQGNAMGGGFEAALAGNILVAERGTKLGFPEVIFGLFPGMGAYTLLRKRVDANTAERIILSARNYNAEDLHQMGIVDILADPGEGEQAIRAYVAHQKNRPGAAAFRRALNKVRVVDHDELYSIAAEWVDAAMELPAHYLKRIDRLVNSQKKYQPEQKRPAIQVIN